MGCFGRLLLADIPHLPTWYLTHTRHLESVCLINEYLGCGFDSVWPISKVGDFLFIGNSTLVSP